MPWGALITLSALCGVAGVMVGDTLAEEIGLALALNIVVQCANMICRAIQGED